MYMLSFVAVVAAGCIFAEWLVRLVGLLAVNSCGGLWGSVFVFVVVEDLR